MNTEVSRNTRGVNPTGYNIKKKKEKETNFLNEVPERNTIGDTMVKKHMRTSKLMGRLTNKPSLKKNDKKKKEKEM